MMKLHEKSNGSLLYEPAEQTPDIRMMLTLLRIERIRLSRATLWEFCKTLHGDFYTEDRPHLKILCDTLQALYEGRLLKPDGTAYRNIIINMPPRHGKSRTLVLFCMWAFGKNKRNRVITCSYGDDEAQDFSRYTRDGISEEKIYPHEIVYSDIFPDIRIKEGNASFHKWALDGEFFSYKGAGIGGSITGKGGKITIVDDPVKNYEEAFNELTLVKIWKWFTGTFLSRKEEGVLRIVNMTRWAKKDLTGRILTSADKDNWYHLVLEARNKVNGEMLCSSIYSIDSYESDRRLMDSAIFMANYHQQPVDIEGALYKNLKTYTETPPFETIENYTDVADKGDDYLCSITYGKFQGEAWILDVLYTIEGMEKTEPAMAEFLFRSNTCRADMESNNGGRSFARALERILWEQYQTKRVEIASFHQSMNKMSRILTQSGYVMNHIYFPFNWKDRWPDFYDAVTSFQKEGKNKNDDAPDALTGVAERTNTYELPDDDKNKPTSKATLGFR